MTIKMYSQFCPPPSKGTSFVGEPLLTQQHYKDEVDIIKMIQRAKQGRPYNINPLTPKFGDFSGITSYAEALDKINAAQNAFEGLPALVKQKFGQNPANMLEWLEQPKNKEEAQKLGLLIKNDADDIPPAVSEEPKSGGGTGAAPQAQK